MVRGCSQPPAIRYLTWTNDQLNEWDKRKWWIEKEQSSTESLIESKLKEVSNYSWVDRQLELDRIFILPGLLVKMDMASMAASLEARSPFLDHRVVEFAARLPDSYKVGIKEGKRTLRDAYRGLLDEEVITGKKKGFEIPLYLWLTNDLRGLAADTLLNPNAKIFTCLDQEQVRLLIKQETMNERNWAYLVYALLILELWLQKENKGF
jgi:asparagine synthase (glutamine-hydrolysing)